MAIAILTFVSPLSVWSQLDHKLVWSIIHNRRFLQALFIQLRKIPLTPESVLHMLKPVKSDSLI